MWDPYSYQQAHPTQPLIIASYTLQMQDAHGLTQLPQPGRFTPNQQMKFALYKPQAYTPLASACPRRVLMLMLILTPRRLDVQRLLRGGVPRAESAAVLLVPRHGRRDGPRGVGYSQAAIGCPRRGGADRG